MEPQIYMVDESEARSLANLYRSLADPTRVRITSLLLNGEMCVGEIATQLAMSISSISHQLALMRLLRVVASRRDGHQVFYRLDDEHIEMVFRQGIDHIMHTSQDRV